MLSLLSAVSAVVLGTNAASAAGGGVLNGYWGQNGYIYDRLSDYCDSGIKYATLSFINQAPEWDNATGYPGMAFAAHCGGEYYYKDGHKSNLLKSCQTIKEDIPYCKARGVTILLSIGGEYAPDRGGNYKVTTEENGVYFAEFLHKAFGPYDPTWDGPRPFDLDEKTHNVIDGYDIDVEQGFDNKPYIAMIERLRELQPEVLITAAPQCPLTDPYYYLKEMIQKTKFDALFIQFYNNIGCDAVIGDYPGDYFNYDDWEDILDKSDQSQDAKLFIGLIAVPGGSGYVTAKQMRRITCLYQKRPHFGGISLWDLTLAQNLTSDGMTYMEHAVDVLKNGCPRPPPVTTTSTTTTSSITSTSTSESEITTATTTVTSSSSESTSTTEPEVTTTSTSSVETSSEGTTTVTSSSSSSFTHHSRGTGFRTTVATSVSYHFSLKPKPSHTHKQN